LTTLDGLVLYSRIYPHCINTDERILEFTRCEKEMDTLQEELQSNQHDFIILSLLNTFNWLSLSEAMERHFEDYEDFKIPDKNECVEWARALLDSTVKQQEMADKFSRQLQQLLPLAADDGYQYLHQRVMAGSEYFIKAINETVSTIQEHIKEVKPKSKSRKYPSALSELCLLAVRKKQQLNEAIQITEGLLKGMSASELLQIIEEQHKTIPEEVTAVIEKTPKLKKGESHRTSLELFREGNNIVQIAQLRNLAVSTIESHLATFISTGELDVKELVSEDKLDTILHAMEEIDPESRALTPIKAKLGDGYSFGEIRAVVSYREWLATQP
jgi:uncharacterized protein YpbB